MQIQFIKNKLLIFELDYKCTICTCDLYSFLPSKRRVKLILWSCQQHIPPKPFSDSSSVRSFPRLHRSQRESHPQHGPSGQRRSCRNPGSVPPVHEEPRNQTPALVPLQLLQTPVHTRPAAADADLSHRTNRTSSLRFTVTLRITHGLSEWNAALLHAVLQHVGWR